MKNGIKSTLYTHGADSASLLRSTDALAQRANQHRLHASVDLEAMDGIYFCNESANYRNKLRLKYFRVSRE